MTDPNDLTPREMEVLALAWQCMDTEPKIDYTKLASLTGYTPGSANVTFGKIKRKLKAKAKAKDGGTGTGTMPATPKKGTGGRGKVGTTKKGAVGETPRKRKKGMSGEVEMEREEDEEVDEEKEEKVKVKVKKEEGGVEGGAEGCDDPFFREAAEFAGW